MATDNFVWFLVVSDIGQGDHLFTTYGHLYERDYEVENFSLSSKYEDVLEFASKKYTFCGWPWLAKDIRRIIEDNNNE